MDSDAANPAPHPRDHLCGYPGFVLPDLSPADAWHAGGGEQGGGCSGLGPRQEGTGMYTLLLVGLAGIRPAAGKRHSGEGIAHGPRGL